MSTAFIGLWAAAMCEKEHLPKLFVGNAQIWYKNDFVERLSQNPKSFRIEFLDGTMDMSEFTNVVNNSVKNKKSSV